MMTTIGNRMSASRYSTNEVAETNLKMDLAEAVSHLPERLQAVVALRSLPYTEEAIANLLGISRTTVWSDLTTAYASIREFLSNDEPPTPIEDGEGKDYA